MIKKIVSFIKSDYWFCIFLAFLIGALVAIANYQFSRHKKSEIKYFYVEVITQDNVLIELENVEQIVARYGAISVKMKNNIKDTIKVKEILIRDQQYVDQEECDLRQRIKEEN